MSSNQAYREESNSSPTDDERCELVPRNVGRTRSVPLSQNKRSKSANRRAGSEVTRDPEDAFIVRPTAPRIES